jgi:hypothetical protein
LPIVVGAAGFGVEISLKLQATADATAYAGSLEQISGSDKPTIIAAATQAELPRAVWSKNGRFRSDDTFACHKSGNATFDDERRCLGDVSSGDV